MEIPEQAQQLVRQFQIQQQQMQNLMIQKESLNMQKMEVEKALEELGKTGEEEEVFKTVGPILVKKTKADLLEDLTEKKETINMRLKSFETQEKMLGDKLLETQNKLSKFLKPVGTSSSEGTAG